MSPKYPDNPELPLRAYGNYNAEAIRALKEVRYESTGSWRLAEVRSFGEIGAYGRAPEDPNNPQRYQNRPYAVNPATGEYLGKFIPGLGYSDVVDFNPVYQPNRPQIANVFNADENEDVRDDLRPVNLTDIPTSSSNASRPRTVAAGYYLALGHKSLPEDQRRGRLTVMFRDGTLYNYYDVSYTEWISFQGALSKGPMLNRANKKQGADGILLKHPHGPADISEVPEAIQKAYWSIAREAQLKYATKNRARAGYDSRGNAIAYVPKSASKKSGYGRVAKNGGKNPAANRGQNPGPKKK